MIIAVEAPSTSEIKTEGRQDYTCLCTILLMCCVYCFSQTAVIIVITVTATFLSAFVIIICIVIALYKTCIR